MDINISLLMMTADIISLMLLGTLYFSNKQRMSHDRDMEFIMWMMTITAISNVVGIVFHYFNWNSGLAPKRLVYLSGTWLFLGIVLLGYIWVKFLVTHSVFFLFVSFYIVDSVVLYVRCRKKIGTLKLFPVHVCLVLIIIGLVMQVFFKENSITWTSVAIAVAGIMTALKNELIFIDRLTGLYNRVYLTFLQQEAQKKKSELVAGILREERLQYFDFRADGFGESRAFYFRDPDGIILEMMQPL